VNVSGRPDAEPPAPSSLARVQWRETVNRALSGATGYQLVKKRPAARAAGARPKPDKMRRYYDDPAKETIRESKPWTMTSYERLFALIVAVRYVVRHGIEGEIAECGVWRGGSMQAVARTLVQLGAADRPIHLYDTFEGMPPPTAEDRRLKGPSAQELMTSGPRPDLVKAIATLDDVQDGMARTGYPADLLHYHPGRVQDTIPEHAPDRIALVRLDTDWYESTKHELEHLYDRVCPGGVLIIDDYDYWEGSRKAVDEFLERTGRRLLLVPIDTGRIAVKP
jgi:hypothetical protein